MTIGISVSGKRPSSDVVDLARRCDEAGIGQLWLTEDYFERGAFALAGAVAAATTDLTVGLGVINPWTRHPVLTAMETGVLAELAPDRIILGLGVSNAAWMERDLGIPFDAPLRTLEEATEIIRLALAGEQVDHDGARFRVHARLAYEPRQVPIYLGTKGDRATAFAASAADGMVLTVLSPPEYVAWTRAQVGPDMDLVGYTVVSVDTDGGVARDRIRSVVAHYLGIHGIHRLTRLGGLDEETAAALRARWLDGSDGSDLVSDATIDRFAVAGTPDECRERLGALTGAGMDTILVRDDGVTAPGDLVDRLTMLTDAGR